MTSSRLSPLLLLAVVAAVLHCDARHVEDHKVLLGKPEVRREEGSPTSARELLAAAPTGLFQRRGDRYLYQGDMLLSEEQALDVLQRKVVHKDYRWPRDADGMLTIDYKAEDDNVNQTTLAEALDHWQATTCVRFVEISGEPTRAYIKFVATKLCQSYTGVQDDGPQQVDIGPGCNFGAMVHEIGHALGFSHEQTRSDRDDYVKILYDNIVPDGVRQFGKGIFSMWGEHNPTNQFGVPYDYYSTMQYGPMFFTKGQGPVMLSLDPQFQQVMGEGLELSFMDGKVFNIGYKCMEDWQDACGSKDDACNNDGYMRHDEKTQTCACVCPPNTSGDTCETLNMSYNQAVLLQSSKYNRKITSPGVLTTPDFPHAPRFSYTVIVEAPVGQRVVLKVRYFLFYTREGGICSAFLNIRTSTALTGGKVYCNDEIKGDTIIKSEENILILNQYNNWAGLPGYYAEITFEDA